MIGRRGKVLIIIYIVCLLVLFLMCSTDLIIREPEREIYHIAVIVEDVRSDNYVNFRKGMDQAAAEFNADVHFITLYEQMDVEEQMELMDREQQDGTDALIVVPAVEETIADKQMTVPVILLRAGTGEAAGAGNIVVDFEKMGEQLADEILQDVQEEASIYVLTDPAKQSDMDRMFLKGACELFAHRGANAQLVIRDAESGFRTMFADLAEETKKDVVVLAANQEILTEAAGILSEDLTAADRVSGLYGRGSTVPILNYLDRGMIKGICVTDEFSTGYYSVREAVRALEGAGSSPTVLASYYIEKEDLRDSDLEKLLFPIE